MSPEGDILEILRTYIVCMYEHPLCNIPVSLFLFASPKKNDSRPRTFSLFKIGLSHCPVESIYD